MRTRAPKPLMLGIYLYFRVEFQEVLQAQHLQPVKSLFCTHKSHMLSLERDWTLLSEKGCNMKQMLKYTIIVAYSSKSVSFSDLAKCVTDRHKRQLI